MLVNKPLLANDVPAHTPTSNHLLRFPPVYGPHHAKIVGFICTWHTSWRGPIPKMDGRA
jgi:hypothetical protein